MTERSAAEVLRMFAELQSPNSRLKFRLYADYLRRRSDVDPSELPGPAPVRNRRVKDPREDMSARVSSAIDEAERRYAATMPGATVGLPAAPDLSSLVSLGLTDPPDDGIHLPETADPWRRDVERLTAPHRLARSRAHRHRAAMALRGERPGASSPTGDPWTVPDEPIELDREDYARLLPGLDVDAVEGGAIPYTPQLAQLLDGAARDKRVNVARWHWRRAKGQLRRFADVDACGVGLVRSKCSACGSIHETVHRCGVGRLCVACRAKAATKRKGRLGAAQLRELAALRRMQLDRGRHRWAQRHVTLTVPHDLADRWAEESSTNPAAVAARVDLLFRAWRAFSLRLQKWGRAQAKRDGRSLAWYRGFEWTPGGDGLGHPHFHVWMVSPMLWEADVAEWWAAALTDAGRPTDARSVIVSVRAVSGVSGIAREVTKGTLSHWEATAIREASVDAGAVVSGRALLGYIEGWSLVDVDASGIPIDPRVAAALFATLEGRRLVQTSRGLLEPRRRGCMECGCERTVRTTLDRRPAALRETFYMEPAAGSRTESGRGPPPHAGDARPS